MKYFNSIIWCVFENHGYIDVINLPSHQHLLQKGLVFNNYFAATHPSGPNYRVLASGDIQTPTEECTTPFHNIATSVAVISDIYNLSPSDVATRHNPFILNNLSFNRLNYVDNFDPDKIPQSSGHIYLGFDDQNNAHSGPLYTADLNLSKLLNKLENSTWFNTATNGLYPVFMFVWDESFLGDNKVFCAFMSKGLKPGICSTRYDHYDFNRTMTTILEIPPLGNTVHSSCMISG